MAGGRTTAAIGWVILIAGMILIFLSGVLTGWFAGDGAGGDSGYNATRAILLLMLTWAASGFALWRAGRLKLFAAVLAVAVAGYAAGALILGDPEFESSADSKVDVGLVIGIFGSLIGLLVCWAGARLAGPSAPRP